MHRLSRITLRSGAYRALVALALLLATLAVTEAPSGVSGAASTPATSNHTAAYWLVAADGGIFSFGGLPFYGSMGGQPLNEPVVGMAAVPGSGGYWEVAADGGVFSFGFAAFYGSMGGQPLNEPVVGMAAVPGGGGYWEVAADGGVFSFGNAAFYGSMGGQPLNAPVVGMAAVPGGGGYWEVAADGGVFSFGNAAFYGSMGGQPLNAPIESMTATSGGHGYWFTASDGGIFAFGDARFYGSLGSVPQSRPIDGIAPLPSGEGYWLTNDNGAVSNFGTATYWGSAPQVLAAPVVGMAEATGTGKASVSTLPPNTYGYDISNYQCDNYPPSPHNLGIVQVNGESFGGVNPCLASEAALFGAGLSLYTFLTYGTTSSSADPACATTAAPNACDYGYNAALTSFDEARTAGVDTSVPWWLDVEGKTQYWSSDTAANASLVQGAIEGLHYEGINSVGIYASPGVWNSIVGTYQPAVPYWMAWWTTTGAYDCNNSSYWTSRERLPTGPIELVQFTDAYNGNFDGDYAC